MTRLHPTNMKGANHVTYPFSLIAGIFLGALISTAAAAQQDGTLRGEPQCNPRDEVLGVLAQKYKEQPVAIGLTNQGKLVEVIATADGKTWTIILSNPNGTSCLIAAGEGWRSMVPERGPEA